MVEFDLKDDVKAGQKVTWAGIFVNLLLIGLKFAGGFIGRSQALVADAFHSISDLLSDIIVLAAVKVGRKAPDETHPFGHARIETLASASIGILIIIAAVSIGYNSARSIYTGSTTHPGILAIVVAALSILFKEAVYRYTVNVGKKIKSKAIQANAWHHRSDALSSVAVLAGVVAANIKPEWCVLDAYAALVVSLLIIKVGIDFIWSSILEFTDTAPSAEVVEHIRSCALDVKGVIDVHDIKVRSSGGLYQMELHIVVLGWLTVIDGHRIAKEVESCLHKEVEELDRIIIHVDPSDEEKERGADEPEKNFPADQN